MFRIEPAVIAYDMHPAYLSTRYALRQSPQEDGPSPKRIPVQHHHAHIAACMAENGLDESQAVIGVAFDGTGYGTDGAIWGGEFLTARYVDFRRAAHLAYVPLPGGDTAIRKPYRTALAHLWAAGVEWLAHLPPVQAAGPTELDIIARQLERGLNAVPTSSMGRLFDAVAAISGVRETVTYEAQAAIELEMLVDQAERGGYEWQVTHAADGSLEIEAGPVIRAVVADLEAGIAPAIIAARFHNSVAALVARVCRKLRDETGIAQIALSGGVWQNTTLLAKTLQLLRQDGFTVYTHQIVPPNDGGLSLGQAVIASLINEERG
jgi:hydrogenase maturation protein HypF